MLSAFGETAFKDVKTLGRVLDLLHAHGVSPIVLTHKSARSVRYPDSLALLTPSVRKSAKTISSYHKIRQCGYPMLPDFCNPLNHLITQSLNHFCNNRSLVTGHNSQFRRVGKAMRAHLFNCRLSKADLQYFCRAKARPIVNWGD